MHPWEEIFKNDRWPYDEPFPAFGEVVQIFHNNSCRRILDLGCGNGRHTFPLAKGGFRATGLDISPSGLRLTQRRFASENMMASLVLSDFRSSLPFGDNSFDGLLSTQVIHHARLHQVRSCIREIWRVIAPGGIAFVTVSGKMDEDDDFEAIEPNTFVPLSGLEKGLPHHIFSVEEAYREFGEFQIMDVSVRAEGHVIAVLARKP